MTDKFPGSPRMGALTGIRIEASEGLDVALKYYEDALQEDPINVVSSPYTYRPFVTNAHQLHRLYGSAKYPSFAVWGRLSEQ